jgi:hypothetical protein
MLSPYHQYVHQGTTFDFDLMKFAKFDNEILTVVLPQVTRQKYQTLSHQFDFFQSFALHNTDLLRLKRRRCRKNVSNQKCILQVADICRSDQPCMSLSQCTSSSDHCINYFFTLSKRTEDWLSPTQEKPDATIVDPSSLSGKSSSCGDEFEVLSWSCTSQTGAHPTARKDSVREELKIWLKATSVPLTECEWLTDCCMESGCKSNFHSTDAKGIQEWLMKST